MKTRNSRISSSTTLLLALAGVPGLVCATSPDDSSSSGPISPVEGVLTGVAQTTPQFAFGALIEDVCPGTATTGNQFNLDPNQDLKLRCDEMWANALVGNDIPGVTTGLQASATEEDAAVASLEVDSSSDSVSKIQGRMSSVRGGSTSGFAVTLNGLEGNSDNPLWPAQGAGDDVADTGWGGFFAGTYSYVDRDVTDREVGFQSDVWGFTGGVDYRWNANLLLGIGFSYSEADSDLARNSGKLESDSWGVYGYGTYFPANGTYLDYTIGYTDTSHDQSRNLTYTISQVNVAPALAGIGPPIVLPTFTSVAQSAISDTDSDEFSVSATLGHDWQNGEMTYGPYIGVSYADVDIDGFRERMSNPTAAGSGLAMSINDQNFKSLISRAGVAATFTFQGPWGPVYPYVMAEYLHEFKNDNDPATGSFITDPNGLIFSLPIDSPDRNYGTLGSGLAVSISDNSYFYTNYSGLVGYKDLSVHTVEFGFLIGF